MILLMAATARTLTIASAASIAVYLVLGCQNHGKELLPTHTAPGMSARHPHEAAHARVLVNSGKAGVTAPRPRWTCARP